MRRFAPLLFLAASSLFAANQSREELLKNPKFAEEKTPRFETLTIDSRSQGQTALIAAILGKYKTLTPMLIDAGADVNAADDNNATPLYFAAERCTWTEIVQSLLKHGAKADPKTKGGSTALQNAEWAKCTENAKLISGK